MPDSTQSELEYRRKPECLYPLRDGRRCCECATCHWEPRMVRRILVTGSRDWHDHAAIRYALTPYIDGLPPEADEPVVMHGDARGADKIAALQAQELGFWVESYPADWDQWGKRAGIVRNLEMLEREPDVVLAFRVNGSRGTTHMIEAAKKRNVPVVVFDG